MASISLALRHKPARNHRRPAISAANAVAGVVNLVLGIETAQRGHSDRPRRKTRRKNRARLGQSNPLTQPQGWFDYCIQISFWKNYVLKEQPSAEPHPGAAVLESAGGRDLGLLFEELSESGRQSRLLRVAHAHVAQPLVFGRVELLCEQVSEHVLSRESSHHDGSVVDEFSDLVVADVDVPELSRLRVDAAFEVGPSESVKRRVGG